MGTRAGVTTYRVDCRDAFLTVCLLRLVLVFGIIFMIIGFILLMIGYVTNPHPRDDLTSVRIAGWVIFGIGISIAFFGCLMGCRIVEDPPPETSVAEQGQVPSVPAEELQGDGPQQPVSHPPQQTVTGANIFMEPQHHVHPDLSNVPGAVDDIKSAHDDQAPPSYAAVISGHVSMSEPKEPA
jgi:hypothetical protein